MAEVRVGSGRTVLVLDTGQPLGTHTEAILATLEGKGLRAGVVVHGYDEIFEILVDFFADLEQSFRGWEGERTYASVEGDLRIVATHRGRVVELVVRLALELTSQPWWVEAVVELAPGEDLRRAARDVADAVRGREG